MKTDVHSGQSLQREARNQSSGQLYSAGTRKGVLMTGLLLLIQHTPAYSMASEGASSKDDTRSVWVEAARRHNVDVESLQSIALQESRRSRRDGTTRPWPWTLHTRSTGALYLASLEAAQRKLRELIDAGLRNIDVGIMQVNLHHHGHRVAAPEDLLVLEKNIDTAAQIVGENLKANGGDLRKAIAQYHSGRAELGLPYAAAVLTFREHLLRANRPPVAVATR